MERFWSSLGLQLGRKAGLVAVVGLVLTLALGYGITQLEFATGQDSYLNSDDQVYIDVTFWNELSTRFGADGEFAQPYVLAHEYGHHVQDLLGTEASVRRQMQRDPANQNALSVALELQADCYAGVWAKHATQTTDATGQPIFLEVTQNDVAQAVEAAGAVGDDAIQKKMGGSVNESQFTHGSSAQRVRWFKRGYESGDLRSCDTFSANQL